MIKPCKLNEGGNAVNPIIGITSYFAVDKGQKLCSVSYDCIKVIKAAGGLPLILPIVKDEKVLDGYVDAIDGLFLTGGEDILPLLYKENPISKVHSISYDRDEFEMSLFKKAYSRGIPILGICRGMQLINVSLGGTLYQDLNTQVINSLGHCPQDSPLDQPYHGVKIEEDSKLYDIFGKADIEVNSLHHQSVKDRGKGLKPSAYSQDGIIEGIESTERDFVIGVQWHPEKLAEKYPLFQRIFDSFIGTAKKDGSPVL